MRAFRWKNRRETGRACRWRRVVDTKREAVAQPGDGGRVAAAAQQDAGQVPEAHFAFRLELHEPVVIDPEGKVLLPGPR